ncbi:MAG: hypothetical protein ACLPX5_11660 [Dissulfurispiraceae bacterium]
MRHVKAIIVILLLIFPKPGIADTLPGTDQGTLFVVVYDSNSIVVASDSRITTSNGSERTYSDGNEKIHVLNKDHIFYAAGLERLYESGGKTLLKLEDVVKGLEINQSNSNYELATMFAHELMEKMRTLPKSALLEINRASKNMGQENVFEAEFAGIDPDDSLSIVYVKFYFEDGGPNSRIKYIIRKEVFEGQSISFIGQQTELQKAFNDDNSEIGKLIEFRHWKSSFFSKKYLDPFVTAEAFVRLGIKYSTGTRIEGLGYPIYVYSIDKANGFRKVKVANDDQTVSLPY